MGRRAVVSTCTQNQWVLDFEGNLDRIQKSIQEAKRQGSKLLVSPEMNICGYSCQDHFLESDTVLHSWEVLAELLKGDMTENILVHVGMPVMHKDVLYNCALLLFNRKILLIRPKQNLCDDGNYRESRYFSPWKKLRQVEEFHLPRILHQITGQRTVPIGDAVLATLDTCIGCEICEELWTCGSPHTAMGQDGVGIFLNGSGSHHELRKAYYAVDLIKDATKKNGGVYIFANMRGGDGDRLYFNGNSCVALNGFILVQGKEFDLKSVAAGAQTYPRIAVDFALSEGFDLALPTSEPISWKYSSPEEEIAYGPACFLYDYLRRSKQGGYFLPLSGGRDSATVACQVYIMCTLVVKAISEGDSQVLSEVQTMVADSTYVPKEPEELCSRLFFTYYLASENSSQQTRDRAGRLAAQIGSSHVCVSIEVAVRAILKIFETATGVLPRFKAHGGGRRENLALQNVQARLRMVLSYLFAQLTLWIQGRPGGLLVLGSSNVDESLRGYFTKYDCSSADINPIGSISKKDLDAFLRFCRHKYEISALDGILEAEPTAELVPLVSGQIAQSDEIEMGMSYAELSIYGHLRRPGMCGPYSMFCKLVHKWNNQYQPEEVANKVKHFFRCYALNRHKMTTLTPAYYAESYSPDDHRFDHRPFLYNVEWPWQFRRIDEQVKLLSGSVEPKKAVEKSWNTFVKVSDAKSFL